MYNQFALNSLTYTLQAANPALTWFMFPMKKKFRLLTALGNYYAVNNKKNELSWGFLLNIQSKKTHAE